MLGVKDPLNNFAYEMHRYLDADQAGDSPDVAPGIGATTLLPATQWARENHVKLFFGEFGFGPDAASLAEGKALNDFVHANADVYEGQAFWAAGPWWPEDYFLNLQPTGLGTDHVVDKPQMTVLDDYLLRP
jgi:endoglucanase